MAAHCHGCFKKLDAGAGEMAQQVRALAILEAVGDTQLPVTSILGNLHALQMTSMGTCLHSGT